MSLKFALLAALSEGPKTGYDLAHGIDGSIGLFWSASHQQIYRELGSLKDESLLRFTEIHQEEKPDKKIYELTRSGRAELRRWIAEPTELAPNKSVLLIKVFVGHLVGPAVLLKEIRRIKQIKLRELEKFNEIERTHFSDPSSLPLDSKFQYLTLRWGIRSSKAWLSWSDEIFKLLNDEHAPGKNL